MNNDSVLYYIHDPMCSWCWGFKPILKALTNSLVNTVEIKYLLGGLAADSDIKMPEDMQMQIKSNWNKIQKTIPGIEFNYDFWNNCTPRRSTYPACRAILATKKQQPEKELKMLEAIQQAYYLHAENPSDYAVLCKLANKLNLNSGQFELDIHSDKINNELLQQIKLSRDIGANSFPSLYIKKENIFYPIVLDYNNVDIILEHIQSII